MVSTFSSPYNYNHRPLLAPSSNGGGGLHTESTRTLKAAPSSNDGAVFTPKSKAGGVSKSFSFAAAASVHSVSDFFFKLHHLSGMSLDSPPNPSLNLAAICKLDLSNNNLEIRAVRNSNSFTMSLA
ncbi:hypothetical protein V2J09_010775 [Rumex salicifolius]